MAREQIKNQLEDEVCKLKRKIDLLYKIIPRTSSGAQGITRAVKALRGADKKITKLILKFAEVRISK